MTENAVLLLVALTSGYLFCVVSLPSRFYSAREVGHRLYFRAIFYACFTIVASVLLYIIFHVLADTPCGIEVPILIESPQCVALPTHGNFGRLALDLLQGEEGVGIVFGSLITALALSLLVNTPLYFFKPLNTWLLGVVVRNRDFERLVLRSLGTSTPILLTLENGKVYVGWAVRAPDPIESREFVRIMPLISGYRSDDDHQVKFTTFYDEVIDKIGQLEQSESISEAEGEHDRSAPSSLNHLDAEDFEVVLPVAKVVSAHLFDIEAYNAFSGPESEAEICNQNQLDQ